MASFSLRSFRGFVLFIQGCNDYVSRAVPRYRIGTLLIVTLVAFGCRGPSSRMLRRRTVRVRCLVRVLSEWAKASSLCSVVVDHAVVCCSGAVLVRDSLDETDFPKLCFIDLLSHSFAIGRGALPHRLRSIKVLHRDDFLVVEFLMVAKQG